jgi:cytochrome b561
MTTQPAYGTTAKILHWLTVTLLMVQYPLGWLMPEIHHGTKLTDLMTLHMSFGITILALMTFRLFWRLTHPVPPESSLPAWQKLISEAVHWLLYALVFATTMSGWLFASQRGWSVSLFFAVPLPMLTSEAALFGHSIGRWHGTVEFALLLLIGSHVAAALAHTFVFRDRIMQRMLPEKWMTARAQNLNPGLIAMKPARDSA